MATNIYAHNVVNHDNHKEYSFHVASTDDAIRIASALINKDNIEDIPSSDHPSSADTKKRGPREKSLFIDETTAEQEKNRFLSFLSLHNFGQHDFDSSEENSGNQIAVCFFRQWQRRNLLNHKVSGTALMRFLKDECALSITVEERAFGNALAKMISSEQLYSNWCGEVGTYFNT